MGFFDMADEANIYLSPRLANARACVVTPIPNMVGRFEVTSPHGKTYLVNG